MSGQLEKFIMENREKFDADAPDPRVWEKIQGKMNPGTGKITPIRSLPFKRWMAAAAVLVLFGLTAVVYYTMHKQVGPGEIAGTTPILKDSSNHLPALTAPVDSNTDIAADHSGVQKNPNQDIQNPGNTSADVSKSGESADEKAMYYYAKLIELKHDELKTLEKDEPLLYRQFAGDVQKLDSVYHSLKTQLPTNSNREQVIEAMISNLQLQIGLLNKQLDIIKQIKHSKKSAYEKAYKSV